MDNTVLYDLVHSYTQILDKLFQILTEMFKKSEITFFCAHQLHDSLTKTGVPSGKIFSHMIGLMDLPLKKI